MELSVLKALLEAWNIDISKLASREDGLNERIKAQKLVYLLQNRKRKCFYQYNIYVHGPYSPSLSRDYYELARSSSKVQSSADSALVREAKSLFQKVRKFKTPDNAALSVVSILELLSTTSFFADRFSSRERVKQAVRRIKPNFTDEQVEAALGFSRSG